MKMRKLELLNVHGLTKPTLCLMDALVYDCDMLIIYILDRRKQLMIYEPMQKEHLTELAKMYVEALMHPLGMISGQLKL